MAKPLGAILPTGRRQKRKRVGDGVQDEQPMGKAAARKKRRLDSYIEKKLRKECRVELLEELAASQLSAEATLTLRSTSSLGSGRAKTVQSVLSHMDTLASRRKERLLPSLTLDEEEDSNSDEEVPDPITVPCPNSATVPNSVPVLEDWDRDANSVKIEDRTVKNGRTLEPDLTIASVQLGSALRAGPDGKLPTITVVPRKPKRRRRYIQVSASDDGGGSDYSDDSHTSAPSDGMATDDASSDNADDSEPESWYGIEDDIAHEDPDVTFTNVANVPGPGDGDGCTQSFKEWAQSKLGVTTIGGDRTAELPALPHEYQRNQPPMTGPARGPLGEDLQTSAASLLTGPSSNCPGGSVSVERLSEVQEARMSLPILAEEDSIMEAVRQQPVIIICGETGSGKTTQVPQFLYESGFGSPDTDDSGMIGVTQPRRVAAMSMASRVGKELGLDSSRVSYQIRYDRTVSPTTSIKFMTDGVLLRELATDFLLKPYSAICIDEAHERSINTDVLIGVLSRVVRLREEMWRKGQEGVKPLRLIIMSATLRVADFASNSNLFKVPPPVIDIAVRQFPVTIHFSRRTRPDYLREAYSKVCKIHSRLGPGAILVFLTGQNEIVGLCRKLEMRFSAQALQVRRQRREELIGIARPAKASLDSSEGLDGLPAEAAIDVRSAAIEAEDVEADEQLPLSLDEGHSAEDAIDPEDLDSEVEEDDLQVYDDDASDAPMHVLPLYSLLSTERQLRVFEPPPEGHRLVVVATNVAETSLTIPGIRYVVDCGRVKERHYESSTAIQTYKIEWISKASAAQRAGRAGRTGPGHCYRLYSSALFETYCPQHTPAEIQKVPIEGVVLQMKAMNIDSVTNFPFPTPPDRSSLQSAEQMLIHLGALTPSKSADNISRITPLGRSMSLFPIGPRYARMLVAGRQQGCLPYVIAVVSALCVGELFLREEAIGREDNGALEGDAEETPGNEIAHIQKVELREEAERKLKRRAFYQVLAKYAALGGGASDAFLLLSAVGAYEYEGGSAAFCQREFMRSKAMTEVHKLRAQLSSAVETYFPGTEAGFVPKLPPPTDKQLQVVRQLITASFVDQVAVRADLVDRSRPKLRWESTRDVAYRTIGIDEDVYIHPSSVLFHSKPPEFVVYQDVVRTSKAWMKVVTKISPGWLSTLGRSMCTFAVVQPTAGERLKVTEKEREVIVRPRFGGHLLSVELAPIKVVQRKEGSRWVF